MLREPRLQQPLVGHKILRFQHQAFNDTLPAINFLPFTLLIKVPRWSWSSASGVRAINKLRVSLGAQGFAKDIFFRVLPMRQAMPHCMRHFN